MFLLKKSQPPRDTSGSEGRDAPPSSSSRSSTQESQNNTSNNRKSFSIFRQRSSEQRSSSNPTIIRPAASRREGQQPSVKKRAPPRPPPPKVTRGTGCIPVIPLDPPSYEEVLQADARINSRQRPNNQSTVAASLSPFTRLDQSPVVSRGATSPLIDLRTPQKKPNVQSVAAASSNLNDLLDLNDVFGSLTPMPDSHDILTPSSTVTANILDDDIYQNAEELQHSTTNMFRLRGLGPKVLPTDVPITWKVDNTVSRPVPKPRTSLGSNKTTNATPTSLVINDWGDDSSPFPLIPPRPAAESGTNDDLTSNSSWADTDEPAPPLPPRPSSYIDLSSPELDISPASSFSPQRSEPHGVALYEYTAQQNDELSFKVDDTITLIHRINDEWFYGCVGAQEGMFPRNFIRVVVPLPDDTEFLEEGTNAMSGPRCLAMFDFAADNEEELSFRVGDMLRLVSRVSEHWLKGWLEGNAGLIPANFVRVVEDLPEDDGSSLAEAWVLHAFRAENNCELNCESGDQIKIIYPVDGDWVFAQNDGRIGLVPWTYLDLGR